MIRRLYHERYHHQHHYHYDERQQQMLLQDDNDDNNNNSIPVQSNDVAFAVHALLVSSITLFQIGYYDGFRSQRPSKVIGAIIIVMLTIIISLPIVIIIRGGGTQEILLLVSTSNNNNKANSIHYHHLNWLDYLYVLSTIKVTITLIKYMPQVVLNCRRQSTTGWSIWQILLDMTGGVLSDLQLVLDCAALQDWTGVRSLVL
jgi:cystinosin